MTYDPIVKSIRVSILPKAAFELFTSRIGEWWPLHEKSVSAGQCAMPKALVLEPRVGGALFEIGHDGARHDWGTVEEWHPGHVFATTWHPGKMADHQTRVRVVFELDGSGTLVTLTHSGWEALSAKEAALHTNYSGGWISVLECFAAAQ